MSSNKNKTPKPKIIKKTPKLKKQIKKQSAMAAAAAEVLKKQSKDELKQPIKTVLDDHIKPESKTIPIKNSEEIKIDVKLDDVQSTVLEDNHCKNSKDCVPIQKYDDLLVENKKYQLNNQNLLINNEKLKTELLKQQNDLIDKLQAKSKEMKALLEQKNKELEAKKMEELQQSKISIFEEVINNFIEPICLLETTVLSSTPSPEVKNYLQGFAMIVNIFKEHLNEMGVEEIDVKPGDLFNELYMEAFETTTSPEFKPNCVTKVLKKGFVYKNKVIKYCLVVVNK